ncbi:MAG TPA: tetratricopeptide repeat protein, partial [Blastocatellia bacterium]|nr:tetratricopeptide repeat protein [Blastocatellia bacterium]
MSLVSRITKLRPVAVALAVASMVCSQSFALPQNGSPQDNKHSQVRRVINSAETHFQKGQSAYTNGQYDQARREFDEAVDSILIDAIDVRSDDELRVYYR